MFTFYAVICDTISTNVKKIDSRKQLTDMRPDDVKELIQLMSSSDEDWEGVLCGNRAAVIFDSEKLGKIRINDGFVRVQLNQ